MKKHNKAMIGILIHCIVEPVLAENVSVHCRQKDITGSYVGSELVGICGKVDTSWHSLPHSTLGSFVASGRLKGQPFWVGLLMGMTLG